VAAVNHGVGLIGDVDSFARRPVVNGMGGGIGMAGEFAARASRMSTTTPKAGEHGVNGRVGMRMAVSRRRARRERHVRLVAAGSA
jgi:hypothetical protein